MAIDEETQLLGNVQGDGGDGSLVATKVTAAGMFAAMVPLLGSFEFGFTLMITSPLARSTNGTVDGTVLMNDRASDGLGLTQAESDLFGSVACLGAMVGALLGSWLLATIGRRASLRLSCIPLCLGAVLQAMAQSYAMLFGGRLVTGVGVGLVSVAAPMYIAEVAPASVRGIMGTCHQLLIVTGCLVGAALGLPWPGKWRWLSWAALPMPAALYVLTFTLPRSPRWLASKGRMDDARAALEWLRGTGAASIDSEMDELRDILRPDSGTNSSDVLGRASKAAGVTKVMATLIGLMFFQQCSGILPVVYYGGAIFEEAGFSNGNIGATLAQVTQLVFTGLAVLLVDKLGRKPLLLISGSIMGTSIGALGMFFHVNEGPERFDHALPNTLALALVMLYFAGFALGMGALPWLLMGELSPARHAGVVSSVTTLANWLAAFIVAELFPTMTKTLGKAETFWLFGAILQGALIFIYLALPETKGQTLENIERHYMKTYRLPPPSRSDMRLVLINAVVFYGAFIALVGKVSLMANDSGNHTGLT